MIEIISGSQYQGHPKIRRILSRRQGTDPKVSRVVEAIVRRVRKDGDQALRQLTQKLDGVQLRTIRIPFSRIKKQASFAPVGLRRAITQARHNIEEFHQQQVEKSWTIPKGFGASVGQRLAPIAALGLYVPGGTAAYPSTVLMNAIPAQVAGVDRIAVVTPPRNLERNPGLAAALVELNLDEVYAVGGAQAVAALAYGTPSILRVDKIVGPGNRYVAAAKRMVYGVVDIDMIAGPSEVVVVADSTANARWIAADLLAQAEHDVQASAICITLSRELAHRIQREVEKQVSSLERGAICRRSIDRLGAVIVARSQSQAVLIVNELAPEHLELHLRRPEPFSRKIRNAGAIFLGDYSPEAVGDYFAGPNHVLPTSGTARFSSPLGVYDFVKRTSIIQYSRKRFEKDARAIIQFARAEQLTAHARSVESRLTGKARTTGA
ncbi:MAG: histidinol dehydrogenase [Acidobacteriia bacterium]|nr:histidinol dehydrogenase [Terriglobia bacterium]